MLEGLENIELIGRWVMSVCLGIEQFYPCHFVVDIARRIFGGSCICGKCRKGLELRKFLKKGVCFFFLCVCIFWCVCEVLSEAVLGVVWIWIQRIDGNVRSVV